MKEAIPLYESEIIDLEKLRGPGHAETLRAQWNLAAAFHKAKRLPDAIKLGEATLADCERLLGPGHWETLTTRANLAHAYHAAGQLKRASAQLDRALRDCERALGPDDDLTEAVRGLRKRYLAGRQGAAPIIAPPMVLQPWLSCGHERRHGHGGGNEPLRIMPPHCDFGATSSFIDRTLFAMLDLSDVPFVQQYLRANPESQKAIDVVAMLATNGGSRSGTRPHDPLRPQVGR